MKKEQTKTYQLSVPTFILKALQIEFKESIDEINGFLDVEEREETPNIEEIKIEKIRKKFLLKLNKGMRDHNKDIPYYTTYLTAEEVLRLGKETKRKIYTENYFLDHILDIGYFNDDGEWEVKDEEWYNRKVNTQITLLRALNILNHQIDRLHSDYKEELGNYDIHVYEIKKGIIEEEID